MSKIDTTDLNETYPVSGINNDSQGFRDNFSNIKVNLNHAKHEIDTLQQYSIKADQDNDYHGYELSNVHLRSPTLATVKGDILLADFKLSYNQGQYHSYIIGDNIDISLEDWPLNRYAHLIVELTGTTDNEHSVVFRGPLSTNTLKFNESWPPAGSGKHLVVTQFYTHIVEFWTTNAGSVIYSNHIGKY